MPRILVVDDDRAIQQMLMDQLAERGYEVETCRDGSQVIARLETGGFDLLLLDVLIPHVNGFTLIEEIRSHPNLGDMPVIMISGIYRSRNHKREMVEKHAVLDYLDKPLNIERMMELVEKTLGLGDEEVYTVEMQKFVPPQSATTEPLVDDITHEISDTEFDDDPDEPMTRPLQPPPEEPKEHLIDASARQEREEVETASRKAFKPSPFVHKGNLNKNPVPAILGRLWRDRTSGALLLRREKAKKIIYIHDGEPYGVKSNLIQECLGQLLVGERLITEEQCTESINRMRDSGKRQGEVLVEMRAMTENNLTFALELQLETKLFETFTWDRGDYRFNTSANLPETDVRLEWEGGGVIVEGIRKTFDETRLRGLMMSIMDVPLDFFVERLELSKLSFTERERNAIRTIEPPRTTRELIDAMELAPADTIRVIYTLIALQLLGPAV